VDCTFTLPLTELLKLELRSPALNIHFSTVITVTALLALKPDIFAFFRSCHTNLSKTHTPLGRSRPKR
jgi:hypothetical protein